MSDRDVAQPGQGESPQEPEQDSAFVPADPVAARLVAALNERYVIHRELSGGAMSRVFAALELDLGRLVVIKLMSPDLAAGVNANRFRQEIRLAANLRHPHIVPLLNAGTADGLLFYTMPYISGESLSSRLAHAPRLLVAESIAIAVDVADALAYAHQTGVVHRDVKPANILLEGGHAVVMDFGIALAMQHSAADDTTPITLPGSLVGTPRYMSPEQASGDRADARSDLYSLACVLFEMLTGYPPFVGPSSQSVLVQHLVQPPPAIRRDDVPESVKHALNIALAKSPDARYGSAAQFRDALTAAVAPEPWRDSSTIAVSAASHPPPAGPQASGPIDSLAVLPFASDSADADDEYLADGITEGILNKLTRVSGLRLVPRSTVFSYRHRGDLDLRTVAREVRARALVTGRVMLRNQTLVVSAELTDMATESQLWGDRLTRRAQDILAVQEEVATEIVKSLRLRLSLEDRQQLAHRQTEDSEAYHAYMRGRHQWNKRTRDAFMRAIAYFQEAIDRDPEYAAAFTGLSDTYNVLGYYSFLAPLDAYPRAKAASTRALELEPDLAQAHASLGYTRLFFDWDWEGAAASFRRAIAQDWSYASAHQWYGWYWLVAGRPEEMIASIRTALELDPLSLIINAHMGYALFCAGRHAEALKQLNRAIVLDPDFALTYWPLGAVHVWQGNSDQAIGAFRSLVALTGGTVGLGYLGLAAGYFGQPDIARESLRQLDEAAAVRFVSPLDRAMCHSSLGEYATAFEWLDRAFEARVSDLVRLNVLPWPADMRNDARFATALARLHLPRPTSPS